jgi:hypothetical protein
MHCPSTGFIFIQHVYLHRQRLSRELGVDADEVYKALHVLSGFYDRVIECLALKNNDGLPLLEHLTDVFTDDVGCSHYSLDPSRRPRIELGRHHRDPAAASPSRFVRHASSLTYVFIVLFAGHKAVEERLGYLNS